MDICLFINITRNVRTTAVLLYQVHGGWVRGHVGEWVGCQVWVDKRTNVPGIILVCW